MSTYVDKPSLRKDAQRNRRLVIAAARQLFASQGLKPTLNEIARYAGVGVGTVYRRFDSKAALFDAVFEDALNELVEVAENSLRHVDPWSAFESFVERLGEVMASDRGLREIVYSRSYGGVGLDAARDRLAAAMATLVERAQKNGCLRIDLSQTDMHICALLAGAVNDYAGHVSSDLWRRYLHLLLDGMRESDRRMALGAPPSGTGELDVVMRSWGPAGQSACRGRMG